MAIPLPARMSYPRTRLLLALDSRLFSDLLKTLLAEEPEVEIVGEVGNPAELLWATAEFEADVVIQTWPSPGQMPDVCKQMLTLHPDVVVIGLGTDGSHIYTCRRPMVMNSLAIPDLSSVKAAIRGTFTNILGSLPFHMRRIRPPRSPLTRKRFPG